MTLDEAHDYLNLPANPGKQLVRKRYLELKNNYLKAIYNAPSDHFSTLYRENLQKIEESYSLLAEGTAEFNDRDFRLQQTILQLQQVVSSFHENRRVLDSASRKKLKMFIERIDQLKESLRNEDYNPDPALDQPNDPDQSHPGWYWESAKLKKKYPTEYERPVASAQPAVGIVDKWIDRVMLSLAETTWGRKYLYDRMLMIVILAIVIMGILGGLYVMFPLMFS
jgi:hypothetical protein